MSFDQLGLSPELLRAVADQGYTEPTPVQAQAIPHRPRGSRPARRRPDRHGQDRGLRAAHPPAPPRPAAPATRRRAAAPLPRVLVVVPDPRARPPGRGERSHLRRAAARPLRRRSTAAWAIDPQFRALRAVPRSSSRRPAGSSTTWASGRCDLSRIEILVLDEADRMLDMGFIRDIRKILALLPRKRQNLLFSATFTRRDPAARGAASSTTRPWSRSTPRNTATELTRQVVIRVDRERKRDLLAARRAPAASTRPLSSPAPSTAPTALPSSSSRTASGPPRSTATEPVAAHPGAQ